MHDNFVANRPWDQFSTTSRKHTMLPIMMIERAVAFYIIDTALNPSDPKSRYRRAIDSRAWSLDALTLECETQDIWSDRQSSDAQRKETRWGFEALFHLTDHQVGQIEMMLMRCSIAWSSHLCLRNLLTQVPLPPRCLLQWRDDAQFVGQLQKPERVLLILEVNMRCPGQYSL